MSGPAGFDERVALEAAVAAAEAASGVLLSRFRAAGGKALETWTKAPGALVTDADIQSDHAIATALREAGARGSIISEESRTDGEGEGLTWLVDPLCGTTPFSTGIGHWGVNIALRAGSELVVGALALPTLGELLTAVRGKAIARNGQRYEPVAPTGELADVGVALEVDGGQEWARLAQSGQLKWIRGVGQIYSFSSAAYPLGQLGLGRLHAVVLYRAAPVHVAAGAAVAQEAGIRVTDGRGRPLEWDDDEREFDIVVAGWPEPHAALLEAMTD